MLQNMSLTCGTTLTQNVKQNDQKQEVDIHHENRKWQYYNKCDIKKTNGIFINIYYYKCVKSRPFSFRCNEA